jgi:hypothetical protein
MQPFTETSNSDDDWTGVIARNERKKRQNRLNQRALRSRKRREESKIIPWSRPYRVDRWRIGIASDHDAQPSTRTFDPYLSPPEHFENYTANAVVCSTYNQAANLESVIIGNSRHPTCPEPPPFEFPLSLDHLLHLIHHNVYRALRTNKSLLNDRTFLTKPPLQGVPIFPSTVAICDGLTIIHPSLNHSLPQSLYPTSLQISQAHSSWINMFPFPRLRDNLIQYEDTFDSFELCYDLFGDLVSNYPTSSLISSASDFPVPSLDADGDDIAARRNGLIVWGESWDVEGWEFTPGFVRKWGRLLSGCEKLIEVSNRWRATRGEDSLQVGALGLGQLPTIANYRPFE